MKRIALLVVFSLLPAGTARSQCHEWAHDFALSGFDGPIHAYATFDDGHGPALYVGGDFLHVGEQSVPGIARWDGVHWSPVGSGIVGGVRALAVYDAGSGPALYAGGNLYVAGGVFVHNIARWDGSSWSALGSGAGIGTSGIVRALAVYDDGAGAKLYAAGEFLYAGGLIANNIARWSASGWEAFTSGADGYPSSLCVYDDGSGPKLAVAGEFTQCGSVFASNIARFDGSGFSPLGAGTNGAISALAVFDDGAGPALVAGGSFTSAGGSAAAGIAGWRNGSWSPLGAGCDGEVRSLAAYDEGSGARLFAGGSFANAGGQSAPHLARWDGASWSAPGTGGEVSPTAAIPALGVHDDGSGPALYIGTDLRLGTSSWTHGFGRWNGSAFSAVGPARNNQVDNAVFSLAVHDDGTGAALYAAGNFASAGGNAVGRIARWNGARWSALGSGFPAGAAPVGLCAVDHGAGEVLYALLVVSSSSAFHGEVWRWGGGAWSTVAALQNGVLFTTAAAFDDGSGAALYVGGDFHAVGSVAADGVARFDGSSWSAVGGGLSGPSGAFSVEVLGTHDLGSGPVLVAGGLFDTAGGQPALDIARWDGTSWSGFGGGLASIPVALASYDDGGGTQLYVGCPPVSQAFLQRWDGSAWSLVPGAPNGPVAALEVFDDGSGPALYVGGSFSSFGTTFAPGLARWNGSQWSVPGGGVTITGSAGNVRALQVFDDGTGGGSDLYVGGDFDSCGGVRSPYLGKWSGCTAPIASFCHGDGGELPCPCWNSGAAGHGCANSANPAGAQLGWSGATNPDTLVLASSGEIAGALSIFLQGDAQQPHAPFGDGLRCAAGILKRLYVHNATGGSVSAPIAGEPSISTRSAALGDTILAGTARYYQVYYRDPQLSFCPAPPGSSFNVTNGVVVNW